MKKDADPISTGQPARHGFGCRLVEDLVLENVLRVLFVFCINGVSLWVGFA